MKLKRVEVSKYIILEIKGDVIWPVEYQKTQRLERRN
jgi:hypothetical protein